ncbi:MAG: creatininase family protein [Candidatus Hydrothermarchaeales archaeon]
MRLEELSWPEVKEYLKERKDIILPLGSVEEHGYHLPLSTDTDIALAIADGVSARTGVLVASPVHYGVCNTTRAYAGTTSVTFDSLRSCLRDIFMSLGDSGFKAVYVISGHLGSSHVAALKEAARLNSVKVYFLDLRAVDTSDILETKPFHACESETSLMLYLHPKKVKMEKAVDEEIEIRDYRLDALKKTESGVWGCPTKATREKGKRIFEKIAEDFSGFISSAQG